MIKPYLSTMSQAQAITAADEDSEDVMQLEAADYNSITDAWWVVDTNVKAAGDDSDTFKFELVLSQDAALTPETNKQVCCVEITDIADKRLATAGNHIISINVGKHLKDMLEDDLSDYPYIGQLNTLSAGATISIDAVLSNSEPPTIDHRMVTVSPVSTPSNP